MTRGSEMLLHLNGPCNIFQCLRDSFLDILQLAGSQKYV